MSELWHEQNLLIDGKLVPAASGKTFAVYDPATGTVIANVPEADKEDVDRAVAAARRIEAHIFIAFLAYCLQITLQCRLHALAPGLTARCALETFAAVQMIDVHLPTTDGRTKPDVCAVGELPDDLDTFGLLQVDDDRALAALQQIELRIRGPR